MKRWLLALFDRRCSRSPLLPAVAEAKRLGGGGSRRHEARPAGAQHARRRCRPSRRRTARPLPRRAAAATPAAAAPKRSWMGPIAGLAAGLGLAALVSHLGFGEELANFMMIALLALVAVVVVRLLMRRFGRAGAAARPRRACSSPAPARRCRRRRRRRASAGSRPQPLRPPPRPPRPALPAGFDAAGFERIAKMIFIRMQAANDSGDLNDLRAFTTPEMFAAIRLDLQERGGAAQQTDVVQIDAEVLDVAQEAERQIVSVRFHGLIREAADGAATPFDEVWHLVQPADGSREWAIAGIQQMRLTRPRPWRAQLYDRHRRTRAAWARRSPRSCCSAGHTCARPRAPHATTRWPSWPRERGATLEQWPVDLAEPLPVAQRLRDLARGARWRAVRTRGADQQRRRRSTRRARCAMPISAALATALRVGLEATLLLSAAFLDATRALARRAPRAEHLLGAGPARDGRQRGLLRRQGRHGPPDTLPRAGGGAACPTARACSRSRPA